MTRSQLIVVALTWAAPTYAAELTSAIPGAVAFVDAAQVPKGLKVLKINGALPGDKSYPLK